ncbi:ATPase WRNIP1 [Agrilus planipennis]|uniref:ATPase WRNIP1 n=1 Tax=Agrilus planipennis TaxID=224129 RepID=A0A1W4XUJ1_AGRPL|nr:ATPase WRNIP1 [Agrilus planipennis]
MNSKSDDTHQVCPICFKKFAMGIIEEHVNKCIFLNSNENTLKRKRNLLLSSETSNVSVSSHEPCASSLTDNLECKNQQSNSLMEKSISSVTVKAKLCINNVPLAKKIKPKHLEDFYGQNHVLGKNTSLYHLLQNKEIPNMILWGPPGCGKTCLAGIINEICNENPKQFKFVNLCAASTNIKEVNNAVEIAKNELKFGKKTIIFMDEIHRFNKRQQDSFLLCVENGDITLIGATTENPSFYINSALLSRCRVVVFEKLQTSDLMLILKRALQIQNIGVIDDENSCKNLDRLFVTTSAIEWLSNISDGDARIAINNLELVLKDNNHDNKIITVADIKERVKKSHLLYDRKGEEHYNLISAVHKSIRNSDANAALYWTTRMIMSGEDPLFIARRMVRAASEDIGNADPNALQLAVSTMQGCQLLGMPEADCLLAQCAIYLARAPKSRESDTALMAAKNLITNWKGAQPLVPLHLRNAPTKLMKNLGYGKFTPGQTSCMPEGLENVCFFE